MKKRSYIILLLVLSSFLGKAQYYPLVKDSVHWFVAQVNPSSAPGEYDSIYEYYSNGDTVISLTTYKKVYKRNIESVNNNYTAPYQPISLYSLYAVLREDTLNKKVYCILFQNPPLASGCSVGLEELLYDFNMNSGDSINDDMCIAAQPHPEPWIMGKFNTVLYGYPTVQYDRIGLVPATYYEGIGTWTGLFEYESMINWFILWGYCIGSDVNCNLTTGILVNQLTNALSIYPNPTDGVIQINSIGIVEPMHIIISDVFGKIVHPLSINSNKDQIDLSNLKKGIYFIKVLNSKKILISHHKVIKI